jgi:hypothetical protein
MSKQSKSKGLFSGRKGNKSEKSSTSKATTKKSFKQKINSRTSHWNFAKLTRYILVFGIILALITSYFWYNKLYMTPERRFWTAINNSMATPSVVRTLTEGGSGNQVIQDYRFNFAPQRVVQNKVRYTEKSATTNTSVTTEGIIYPDVQFLRYTEFYNSRSDGENSANLDSVLGQWAVQAPESLEESQINYLSEQVSLVIFGNYGPQARQSLIKQMKESQVYGSDIDYPLQDSVDGKSVDVYTISVKLRAYATILNKAFVDAGFGEFPPLDPDNYREDSLVNGTILINRSNNTIVGVNFGGREEKYSNYGVTAQVVRPQTDMTVEELQMQVQDTLQASQ